MLHAECTSRHAVEVGPDRFGDSFFRRRSFGRQGPHRPALNVDALSVDAVAYCRTVVLDRLPGDEHVTWNGTEVDEDAGGVVNGADGMDREIVDRGYEAMPALAHGRELRAARDKDGVIAGRGKPDAEVAACAACSADADSHAAKQIGVCPQGRFVLDNCPNSSYPLDSTGGTQP